MNSDLFKKLLEVEAENLYRKGSTPQSFMKRITPLLKSLIEEERSKSMAENELEAFIVSAENGDTQNPDAKNCYYDVVDLSMYRAN